VEHAKKGLKDIGDKVDKVAEDVYKFAQKVQESLEKEKAKAEEA